MSVTAVVVVTAKNYYRHTLAALEEQELQAERVILVDARPTGDAGELIDEQIAPGLTVEVINARDAANFGCAVNDALAATRIDTEWLWLLHDDSPPLPSALDQLIRATASARTVGIAGVKQVGYEDPDRLVSVGVSLTRAGRRLPEIEPGEIDQGQYDGREDVFAVGTAGMLIKAQTWRHHGGTDPALGPFLDGAELSRRVRLAGERVVVVPTAKVRHARASLWHGPNRGAETADGSHSFLARRIATLHYRLVTARGIVLPLLAVGILLAGLARAVRRVAANELAAATQELLAPLRALAGSAAVYRSRRRIRKTSTAPRAVLIPLQASRVEVLRQWWNRLRAGRVDRRRKAAPSELEIAERLVITRRRRTAFWFLTLALLGIGALTTMRVFAGGIPLATPLAGGALGGIDQSYQELWARSLSGWAPLGDGAARPEHPFAVVLALLATGLGGPLGVPASIIAKIFLGFALPLAGISAWYAAGVLTRSASLRLWIGGAWALLPVLSVGVSQGRLPAVVAYVLLPLLGVAIARAFGVDQKDLVRPGTHGADGEKVSLSVPALSRTSGSASLGAAAAAGLIAAGVAASAPTLLPALLIIAVLPGLLLRRGAVRTIIMVAPTVMLFLPRVIYGIQHGWEQIFEPADHVPINLTEFADPQAPWWQQLPWPTLVGWVGAPNPVIPLGIITAFLAVLALIGLCVRGIPASAARIGWLLVALGVGTTAGAGFILGAPQYDWLGSFQRLPLWAGSGSALAAAGLIMAAGAGAQGIATARRESPAIGWRIATGVVSTGLVAALGLGGFFAVQASTTDPLWGPRTVQPLPALARQSLTGPDQARVLVLAPSEQSIAAQVWRANGPQLLDRPLDVDPSDEARTDLRLLAAELYVGQASELPKRLAAHGLGFVLVPNPTSDLVATEALSREELVASLDAVAVLERVTQNDSGTLWRVNAVTSRVRIMQGESTTPVPSMMTAVNTPLPALPSTDSGTLVLSERSDPRWRATLDGRSLRSVTVGWQQAFELPADASGVLRIDYYPFAHRVWRIGFIAVGAFTVLLALPYRRRPEVVQ